MNWRSSTSPRSCSRYRAPKVEIRRDGWMSARSVVDPPVIVSFEAPGIGHLQYRSGQYDVWHSNVHAVALTLERLRLIEGYGCVVGNQQYTGWASLPAGSALVAEGTMDTDRAKTVIASVLIGGAPERYDKQTLAGAVVTKRHYRDALKAAHPDGGGTRIMLESVQEAGRVLGLA